MNKIYSGDQTDHCCGEWRWVTDRGNWWILHNWHSKIPWKEGKLWRKQMCYSCIALSTELIHFRSWWPQRYNLQASTEYLCSLVWSSCAFICIGLFWKWPSIPRDLDRILFMYRSQHQPTLELDMGWRRWDRWSHTMTCRTPCKSTRLHMLRTVPAIHTGAFCLILPGTSYLRRLSFH